jgi:hypothetical protein
VDRVSDDSATRMTPLEQSFTDGQLGIADDRLQQRRAGTNCDERSIQVSSEGSDVGRTSRGEKAIESGCQN